VKDRCCCCALIYGPVCHCNHGNGQDFLVMVSSRWAGHEPKNRRFQKTSRIGSTENSVQSCSAAWFSSITGALRPYFSVDRRKVSTGKAWEVFLDYDVIVATPHTSRWIRSRGCVRRLCFLWACNLVSLHSISPQSESALLTPYRFQLSNRLLDSHPFRPSDHPVVDTNRAFEPSKTSRPWHGTAAIRRSHWPRDSGA
jgi:hypothetical protein